MPLVSIVVPLYDQWPYTQRCLEAIEDTTRMPYELVLVDNGSCDDTADHPVQVRNEHNRGFAVACNQGAAYARGDIVVFLNNDTEPHDGWLDAILAEFDDPDVGVVGAKLVYPHGLIQHSGVVVDLTLPPGQEARGLQEDLPARDVDAVTGACLAIRPGLFWMVGGFDMGFWNGYEDVDLCLKTLAAGYRIRYTPDAVVTHHESKSGPERWTKVRENVQRLRSKWGSDV